jgi:enterobactin synthetase component D
MSFQDFKLLSSVKKNCRFINDIQYWHNHNRNLHLVEVDFNIVFYKREYFSNFSILFPNEIKNAVDKRQADFIAGRIAAREALLFAGFIKNDRHAFPNVHIGKHRSPLWPKGFVGSISHTHNKAICITGEINNINSVGIDLENILSNRVFNDIKEHICTTKEYELLIYNGFSPNIAGTLIFSAKESIFKTLYSTINDYFGFEIANLINVCSLRKSLVFKLNDDFYRTNGLNQTYTVSYTIDCASVKTLLII